MNKTGTDSAPASVENSKWTLIRGARQVLTLGGATGPRRGSAMADLSIIPGGAVLIRDGEIVEVGTARRVENLVTARVARELDADGKIVMPAFVDPDVAIASPSSPGRAGSEPGEADIRRMSRRRLETQAATTATSLARYGVLTVGAHTLSAPDLQNTLKALRLHRAMQSKPLRVRSIFAPDPNTGKGGDQCRRIGEIWMQSIFRKRLASIMDISVDSGRLEDARAMASAAAANGYNIRFRISGPISQGILELAYSAGAIALIGPVPDNSEVTRALADVGCVTVILARILAGHYSSLRDAVDAGIPLALASGYSRDGTASMNPQFLLYMACQARGMTVEEAIVAATYNAACSLRLSHVTGSLGPGKSADICVMDVDDYRELARRGGHHDVSLVMRAGKIVYRRTNLTLD